MEEVQEEVEEEVEEVLDDVPQRVLPGLYLGSLDAAQNLAALRQRGVTCAAASARTATPGSTGAGRLARRCAARRRAARRRAARRRLTPLPLRAAGTS